MTITAGMVGQPVRNFMELWGLDPASDTDRKKLNDWCLTEKVPGAFKGPDGSWWVLPILLVTWDKAESVAHLKLAE